MKAPIAVEVRNGHLVPADAYASEQIDALPRGARLNAAVTVARGGREDEHMGLLRLFWAGMNLLHANVDDPERRYPTPAHLKKQMLLDLGFYSVIQRIDGEKKDPDSISLEKMDLEDFRYLFELCKAYAVARFGFDPWTLWIEEKDAQKGSVP